MGQDGSIGNPVILATPERNRGRSSRLGRSRSPAPGRSNALASQNGASTPQDSIQAEVPPWPLAFNIGDEDPHIDGMYDFVADMQAQVPQEEGAEAP